MQLKFVLLLCLLAYSASATIDVDIDAIMSHQHQAMHLLVRKLSVQSPAVIDNDDYMECFPVYEDNQKIVTTTYQTDLGNCKGIANDARAKLTEASAAERADMLKRGNNVCSQLSACDQVTDGLAFFQCYNAASSNGYPVVYKISVDSEAQATNLQVSYNTIKNNEVQCTTEAKNAYVSSLAKCNQDLEDCLNGIAVPKPTTEAPVEETEAPTDEPIVTVEPTTEAPIVTEEPVEATTEKDVTTDAPAEATPEEPESTEAPQDGTTEEQHIEPNMDLMPEEDLHLFKEQSRLHLWSKLRRL